VMSVSTQRISWNLGAADEPTQDNPAVRSDVLLI
jgi:hypothetical protein